MWWENVEKKCRWCWVKAIWSPHSCLCTHLLGLAAQNRTHEVDARRYYGCKRLQESQKRFNFQNKKTTTKKNHPAKRSVLRPDQERQEDEKKKDERLVFPKPIQLVMLEVWNISLGPPAALQDCELLQQKPACSSSPPPGKAGKKPHRKITRLQYCRVTSRDRITGWQMWRDEKKKKEERRRKERG